MSNFIDKTFSVIADLLIKILPASKKEKKAFSYYKTGMAAQNNGNYSKALKNYFEALQIEEDIFDRSYILYNIGLVYHNMDLIKQALEFYHQAIELNQSLPQAYYNIGKIYQQKAAYSKLLSREVINTKSTSYQIHKTEKERNYYAIKYDALGEDFYEKAKKYFTQAIKLAPDNYPNVKNWLDLMKTTNNNLNLK